MQSFKFSEISEGFMTYLSIMSYKTSKYSGLKTFIFLQSNI